MVDFSGTEPDNQLPQDDPGITMWPSSYNEYTYNSLDAAWEFKESHKELIIRAVINGETWYGRIPLFAKYPTEGGFIGYDGSVVPNPYELAAPVWDSGTPQNTINALTNQAETVYKAVQRQLSTLTSQGIPRGWTEPVVPPG